MDLTVKAYIAGMLDGEGTVTLSRHHKNETHAPEVTITNCDLGVLKWIKEKVGMGYVIKKKFKRDPKHSDAYAWTIRNDAAINLLKDLYPYLIIKRERAELIIEGYKIVTKRNGRYTPEEMQRKDIFVAKIRELNRR